MNIRLPRDYLGPNTFTADVVEMCECFLEDMPTEWGDYITKLDIERFLLQHPLFVYLAQAVHAEAQKEKA